MNTRHIALDYLRKAKARLAALHTLLAQDSYDDVIRESQEILELITKGALRWIGIEPPKTHDVGATIKKFQGQFPEFWQVEINWLLVLSKGLAEERGHAFYGDEAGGVPAADLFQREDAEDAIRQIQKLVSLYEQLLIQR